MSTLRVPSEPEFRRDPVSGEWVLVAPRRGRRPSDFRSSRVRLRAPRSACPFARLFATNEVMAWYDTRGVRRVPDRLFRGWRLAVTKNKFPAVLEQKECPTPLQQGLLERMRGTGHHYLIVTRHHDRNFPTLTAKDATLVLKSFQGIYKDLALDPCIKYVSMFQNWGPSAGASVYHPHYQVIALPVVPMHVRHSINRAVTHYRRTRTCLHCALLKKERAAGTRVIARNRGAIAVAPFAPRKPFEVRVFPTRHIASFLDMHDRDLAYVADMLRVVLRRMRTVLRDPDYNFFIHTAPLTKGGGEERYHWHIEIFPHLNTPGGFEFATHLDINTVPPELAAKMLRGA